MMAEEASVPLMKATPKGKARPTQSAPKAPSAKQVVPVAKHYPGKRERVLVPIAKHRPKSGKQEKKKRKKQKEQRRRGDPRFEQFMARQGPKMPALFGSWQVKRKATEKKAARKAPEKAAEWQAQQAPQAAQAAGWKAAEWMAPMWKPAAAHAALAGAAPSQQQSWPRQSGWTTNDAGPGHKDCFGREIKLSQVVVNFANIGHTYGRKVLKLNQGPLFDWEGVRRCVRFLHKEMRMQVTGVIPENFTGQDNQLGIVSLPKDISNMCQSVEETPRVRGRNHLSADDEMTIKCAYRRSCRFMDNDNYEEWIIQLADSKARTWLQKHRELLHMRYYFDGGLGTFDVLAGNYPISSLAHNEEVDKKNLSRMGRG
ncbi:unnamed protein product [Effrenium voratum]|nr:unnamed protein product [Effrenium voratum]